MERMELKLEAAREKQIEAQVKITDYAEKAEKAEKNAQLHSQQLATTNGGIADMGRAKVSTVSHQTRYHLHLHTCDE